MPYYYRLVFTFAVFLFSYNASADIASTTYVDESINDGTLSVLTGVASDSSKQSTSPVAQFTANSSTNATVTMNPATFVADGNTVKLRPINNDSRYNNLQYASNNDFSTALTPGAVIGAWYRDTDASFVSGYFENTNANTAARDSYNGNATFPSMRTAKLIAEYVVSKSTVIPNQGTENAGAALVVNATGDVTPAKISTDNISSSALSTSISTASPLNSHLATEKAVYDYVGNGGFAIKSGISTDKTTTTDVASHTANSTTDSSVTFDPATFISNGTTVKIRPISTNSGQNNLQFASSTDYSTVLTPGAVIGAWYRDTNASFIKGYFENTNTNTAARDSYNGHATFPSMRTAKLIAEYVASGKQNAINGTTGQNVYIGSDGAATVGAMQIPTAAPTGTPLSGMAFIYLE